MRASQTFLAALSAALAQAVRLTNSNYDGITAGEPFTVTFDQSVGPTELYFGTGSPNDVQYQGNLIGTQPGASGSFSWTPPSGGDFALVIKDTADGSLNYSPFFVVEGDVASTTTKSDDDKSTTTTGDASTTTADDDDEDEDETTVTSTTTIESTLTTTCTTGYNTTIPEGPTGPTVHPSVPSQTVPGEAGPTDVIINGAASISSPLALVFLALGALMTLN